MVSEVQPEFDFGLEDAPKMTEAEVTDALYAQVRRPSRQRPAVRCCRRRSTPAPGSTRAGRHFVAMDMWPSAGTALPVTRSRCPGRDWLRELKDPSKAAEFRSVHEPWWSSFPTPASSAPGNYRTTGG